MSSPILLHRFTRISEYFPGHLLYLGHVFFEPALHFGVLGIDPINWSDCSHPEYSSVIQFVHDFKCSSHFLLTVLLAQRPPVLLMLEGICCPMNSYCQGNRRSYGPKGLSGLRRTRCVPVAKPQPSLTKGIWREIKKAEWEVVKSLVRTILHKLKRYFM